MKQRFHLSPEAAPSRRPWRQGAATLWWLAGWLVCSGVAAQTVPAKRPAPEGNRSTADGTRATADSASAAAATGSRWFYLLAAGHRCQVATPGQGQVPSWVDRIEWRGGQAWRWGSRCNDTVEALPTQAAGAPRLSEDGQRLFWNGQAYLWRAQPPAGDGVPAEGRQP